MVDSKKLQPFPQGKRMDHSTANMAKYLGIFGLIYLGTLIVITVIFSFFEGASSSVVNLVMLYLSGQLTAMKFVKDEKRLPEKAEKRKLIWGSVLLSLILPILLAGAGIWLGAGAGGFEQFAALGNIPSFFWALIILVVVLIHWGLLSLAYGRALKKNAPSENTIKDTFD